VKMRMLWWSCSKTLLNMIPKMTIKNLLGVALIIGKLLMV